MMAAGRLDIKELKSVDPQEVVTLRQLTSVLEYLNNFQYLVERDLQKLNEDHEKLKQD